MDGYRVVTTDGDSVGTCVGGAGENLVVETGLLRKTRHAVPRSLARVDDGAREVVLSVTKDIVHDAPTVGDGDVDERAVLRHYGLAGGFAHPDTEGYGDTLPDDPGLVNRGTIDAEEERARVLGDGGAEGDSPEVHGRVPNAVDPGGTSASDL